MALKLNDRYRVEAKLSLTYAHHMGHSPMVMQPMCIPNPGSIWITIGECSAADLTKLQMEAVNLISGDIDRDRNLGAERIRCQIVQTYWVEE